MFEGPAGGSAEAFEKVKSLLLGDTTRRLDETVERVEKIDQRVNDGDALVDALKRAEETRPKDLSGALAPLVVSLIRSEIKNSKDMMIEALYPIMGRLVTAAVAGAFRDLVEGLNARIDALASANSWKLRLRAMATGRTMAEVALAEAEAGRLKRALLLERGSGRLLAIWPEKPPGAEGGKDNADLESGMIAAITEFATNIYADKGGELRMLDIGSGKVFLRASPRVIVAGEFGGELSRQRERRLDEAFLSIVEKHEEDAASCTPETIEQLLDGALTEPAKPKSKTPAMIVGAAAAGLAIWLAWGPAVRAYREWRIGDAFATAMAGHEALGQFPLRLDVEHASERVVLRGLAANEAEPQAIIEAIAPAAAPYRVERDVSIVALASQTQDLRAGETRAAATLQEAQAQIEALRSELEEARAALGRMTAAHESPTAKLRRFVESFAVFFSDSDTFVNPAAAAGGLDELAALLKVSDSGLRVVGYADDIGATVSSRSTSRKRADKIVSMLVERGVPRQRLALVSRSTLNPIADSALDTIRSRRVSFEVPYAGEFDVR